MTRRGAPAPDPDLVLDDELIAPTGRGEPTDFALPDAEGTGPRDDAGAGRPSDAAAAVLRLAADIRSEGETLAGLAAAARGQAARLEQLRPPLASGPNRPDGSAAGLPEGSERGVGALAAAMRELEPAALEAALAAVRAGAAARGFAAVAVRGGGLADKRPDAWEAIEPGVAALEEQAAEAAALVVVVRDLVRLVERRVADPEALLVRRGSVVAARVAALGASMAEAAQGVSRALVAMADGRPDDRRAERRFAFRSACRLVTAHAVFRGRTVDISRTGALVSIAPRPDLQRGQPVSLTLREVGAIAGVVAGVSEAGVHLSFDLGHAANAVSGRALRPILAGLAHENEALVTRAQDLAAALGAALGAAVETGAAAFEAPLPDDPCPVPSGSDGNKGHPAMDGRVLGPALAAAVEAGDVDEAAALDRSGTLRACAAADGAPTPTGAAAPADWPLSEAARNLRPSLVQVYPDPAERSPDRLVKDVSAPIFVRGRHWGCARLLRRFADPAST